MLFETLVLATFLAGTVFFSFSFVPCQLASSKPLRFVGDCSAKSVFLVYPSEGLRAEEEQPKLVFPNDSYIAQVSRFLN